jgi:hypothetical protein
MLQPSIPPLVPFTRTLSLPTIGHWVYVLSADALILPRHFSKKKKKKKAERLGGDQEILRRFLRADVIRFYTTRVAGIGGIRKKKKLPETFLFSKIYTGEVMRR